MDRLIEATYRAERQHFWFVGFRKFARIFLREATTGMAAPRILDCGCGTGANLTMLEEFGRPFGFDVTSIGLQYARSYGQRRLVRATVTHVPFPGESFDLVCAFDLFYALDARDEAAALAEIFRVLRPGGALVINFAALEILRGNHSVFGHELRRCTRRGLQTQLEQAGFIVTRATYTNAMLFPLMLVIRTVQRAMGLPTPEEAGTDLVVPPRPLNACLTTVLGLEARALRFTNMPVGSSVLCLARKPRH